MVFSSFNWTQNSFFELLKRTFQFGNSIFQHIFINNLSIHLHFYLVALYISMKIITIFISEQNEQKKNLTKIIVLKFIVFKHQIDSRLWEKCLLELFHRIVWSRSCYNRFYINISCVLNLRQNFNHSIINNDFFSLYFFFLQKQTHAHTHTQFVSHQFYKLIIFVLISNQHIQDNGTTKCF